MKPILKGYELNLVHFDTSNESIARGFIDAVAAKNEKDARRELLRICFDHGIEEDLYGEPLTYINIRIKRYPPADKFDVEGKLKTREQMAYDARVAENKADLQKFLEDHRGGYAYILKGGYYYRPGHCGYTERRTEAGVYSVEEAVQTCIGVDIRDYMRPELVNIVEHNAIINTQIEQLRSRIL